MSIATTRPATPERQHAIEAITQFSVLMHAKLKRHPAVAREAARALKGLGIQVTFRSRPTGRQRSDIARDGGQQQ